MMKLCTNCNMQDMSNNMSLTERAEMFMAQANKLIHPGAFGLLTSSTERYEDASELFAKAGNMYKVEKSWERAGTAFQEAAKAQLYLNSKHEAGNNYYNAAQCFKKINSPAAIQCLTLAIDMYVDEGRLLTVAKYHKELGEMLENENDFDNAAVHYQLAGDFYDGEGNMSNANGCFLKVAQHKAILKQYEEAIILFEKIVDAALENNLMRWSVKEYFLEALICKLANEDVVATRMSLNSYCNKDPSFARQREAKFIESLISAYEAFDQEAFSNVAREFDSISPLDKWKTELLLRIKKAIKSTDEDGLA